MLILETNQRKIYGSQYERLFMRPLLPAESTGKNLQFHVINIMKRYTQYHTDATELLLFQW